MFKRIKRRKEMSNVLVLEKRLDEYRKSASGKLIAIDRHAVYHPLRIIP